MKLQVMYELFQQLNLPYNLRRCKISSLQHKKYFYDAETLSYLRWNMWNLDPCENEYLESVAFLQKKG